MVSHSLSDSIHSRRQLLDCDLHRDPTAASVLHILPLLIQLGMHCGTMCVTAGELETWPILAQNLYGQSGKIALIFMVQLWLLA